MNDILPDESAAWQRIEGEIGAVLAAYGYEQIRLPLLESTDVFERGIGDVTDIVEKEMYTFLDRNGESVSLRPEGTAGCVRAVLEHGLAHNQSRRLWYAGPMFRHEKPQKGRYRQFHQVGVEVFGLPGPDIDAEIILMTARIWARLGLEGLQLQLNTLGTAASRAAYRAELVEYFQAHSTALDADSLRRLERNPLRILDSKNPDMQALIAAAPAFAPHLDTESAEHFDALQALLAAAGLQFELNPRLVRGLDYYGRTVFEWVTDRLGAQGTVCAGGRYDTLVEQFGGRPTPAVGFALGLERLVALVALCPDGPEPPAAVDVYLVVGAPSLATEALLLAEGLRRELPGLRLLMHCGPGGMKAQFKRADRSGARYALVLGK